MMDATMTLVRQRIGTIMRLENSWGSLDGASPALAVYAATLDERLPEAHLDVIEYLPHLIGSESPSKEAERARCLAWRAITVFLPVALRAVGLDEQADGLAGLPCYQWDIAETQIAALLRARRSVDDAGQAARVALSAATDAKGVDLSPMAGPYAACWAAECAGYAAKAATPPP